MTYTIKELSQVEKQVTVWVPRQEVDITIETIIAHKRKTFDKKGFRKEKVPDSLIFQELKDEIYTQAAQQIFESKVEEVQALYKIVPLNALHLLSEATIEKGKDFTFSFVVETFPDLEIPEFKGIEIEIKEPVATEEDIDHIIASMREQMCRLEEIKENRLAVDGDVVVFDFESQGEFKKVMGMSGTNNKLELGTGQNIEDFEKIIKSLKPGESKTGIITYPPDFPNPILAEKSVETQITLKALNRKILPEIDEKLAQESVRVNTVFEMREILRQRHLHRLTYHYEQDARRKILDSLLQKVEIPLIPSHVTRNLENMFSHYSMTMQQRGMTTEEITAQADERKKLFLPEAKDASKRQLLLLAIAKKEQMNLDPQEIEQEVARRAETMKTDVNQFMQEAQQSGLISIIKDDLIMQKVMNLIYEKAKKTIIK